jgi:Stress responsive A/B Barrel Domain
MKRLLTFILSFTLIILSTFMSEAQSNKDAKVLRHVVLFKFKDTSSGEDVKKVEKAFADLAGKLKLIKGYEWGTNNSPENLNQGLTHCFILTFSTDKDRDEYLIHPDHKAFGKILGPHLDKVTVVDFWTEK